MSEVGLMPREFYSLTFYEYTCVLAGYILRKSHTSENSRYVAYMIYKMNTGDKTPIKIDKFWPLITDQKEVVEIIKPEDKELLIKQAKDRLALFGK